MFYRLQWTFKKHLLLTAKYFSKTIQQKKHKFFQGMQSKKLSALAEAFYLHAENIFDFWFLKIKNFASCGFLFKFLVGAELFFDCIPLNQLCFHLFTIYENKVLHLYVGMNNFWRKKVLPVFWWEQKILSFCFLNPLGFRTFYEPAST